MASGDSQYSGVEVLGRA